MLLRSLVNFSLIYFFYLPYQSSYILPFSIYLSISQFSSYIYNTYLLITFSFPYLWLVLSVFHALLSSSYICLQYTFILLSISLLVSSIPQIFFHVFISILLWLFLCIYICLTQPIPFCSCFIHLVIFNTFYFLLLIF